MDGEAALSKLDMQALAVFKGGDGRAPSSPRQRQTERGADRRRSDIPECGWRHPPVRSSPIKQFRGKCYLV